MAKTLKKRPEFKQVELALVGFSTGPVHWLKNVDGDPHRVETACKKYGWANPYNDALLDPNRKATDPVTCPECLAAMAGTPPVIVEPT